MSEDYSDDNIQDTLHVIFIDFSLLCVLHIMQELFLSLKSASKHHIAAVYFFLNSPTSKGNQTELISRKKKFLDVFPLGKS